MRYVYGPIPSRRLGQSLGIDPIPLKTCNWNCVYCQLGRTQPLLNERKDYVPPQEILAEVRQALAAHAPGTIDWVSFVGSGEPTLHASLGWLIRQVQALTAIPVAVITNGALACWAPGQVSETLAELVASGRAQVVERYGTRFWSAAPAHYPAAAQRQSPAPIRARHHQTDRRT